MEKKKQSSIEWLENELNGVDTGISYHYLKSIMKQAKAMHKEEIEEAYVYGVAFQIDIKNGLSPIFYYNDRFGDEKEVL